MIVYQSPHIRLVDQVPFISKLQGTGLIPQCDNQATCDSISDNLGVTSCPGQDPAIVVQAFLPGVACSQAPTCSITNIINDGSPVPSFNCPIVDPSPQDCSEGGCLIIFNCTFPADPACGNITAEVTCTGGEPVSCANNVPL